MAHCNEDPSKVFVSAFHSIVLMLRMAISRNFFYDFIRMVQDGTDHKRRRRSRRLLVLAESSSCAIREWFPSFSGNLQCGDFSPQQSGLKSARRVVPSPCFALEKVGPDLAVVQMVVRPARKNHPGAFLAKHPHLRERPRLA